MGACADTGHWLRSGLQPIECLKKLEGRILVLHFKDLAPTDPVWHDVPWGAGVADVRGMMVELKRQGFKGAFCVEYEYHWESSLPEIAQGLKYFESVCRELAGGQVKP
jgi:sugar phosphate isomerase/epimerase